jgi:predicted HTH transcriptional regulator
MSKNLIDQPLPPEGQYVEYKLTLTRPEILARLIASFANSEGGKIIIGVNDDLSIVGLTEEAIEKAPGIVGKALQQLRPHPLLNYQDAEINGKSVFVIEVQKNTDPVLSVNGRFYVRRRAVSIVEEETLIHALVKAVPIAKANILTSLGINVQDTVKVEETTNFNEIVHQRIEEEQNFKLDESLSRSIRLTRVELFNERSERRIQA